MKALLLISFHALLKMSSSSKVKTSCSEAAIQMKQCSSVECGVCSAVQCARVIVNQFKSRMRFKQCIRAGAVVWLPEEHCISNVLAVY